MKHTQRCRSAVHSCRNVRLRESLVE